MSDVTKDSDALLEALGPETYQTKTRGQQDQAPARPVGEGLYAIVRHGDHTHLVTQLELPDHFGKAQRDLNLKRNGNYIIAVKNPEKGSSPWAGLDDKRDAEYPKKLQTLFEERNFIPMDPPEFMDHEGCEFTVIGVDKDARDELGIDLDPEDEDKRSAEIFRDLGLEESVYPTKPLFEGKWA